MQFLNSLQEQIIFIISQIFSQEGFASCTDQASIDVWQQTTKSQIFDYFIPQKIADFNTQFAAVYRKVVSCSFEQNIFDTIDRILHFFAIKYLQLPVLMKPAFLVLFDCLAK